jgi:uncharacterized membrane protein
MLILILLILFLVAVVSAFGAGAIIIFGDVIVCVALLIWLTKLIFFRHKKSDDK